MLKCIPIVLFMMLGLLVSCNQNEPDPTSAEPVKDRSDQKIVTGDPREDLYANAIQENDVVGRAKWALGLLQEELNKSAGTVPGLGKVTVLIDNNLLTIVRNEHEGNIHEQRINLSNLNPDVKSVGIIVDKNPGEFPGLKLAVKEGEKGVGIFKNGDKVKTEDYLEIVLATREQVQKVTGAMMKAVQAANGEFH